MINRMMIQLFRQWSEDPATNPFPVAHMPDSLTEALKAAAEGKLELNDPVQVPEGFRGRIGYDKKTCIGCRLCIKVCPAHAIDYLEEEKKVLFHMDRCCFCAQCTEICPVHCIWMTDEFAFASYERKKEVVTDSGKRPSDEKPGEPEETKGVKEQKEPKGAESAAETEGGGGTADAGTATYHIDPDKCIGCTQCSRVCPVQAISGAPREKHVIDEEKCIGCAACAEVCPVKAISPR
ncbi:MAG: NAD(P)H-quinone oxidoreductase subunit I [Synergistetes bacterium ADurb.Bin155]|jgi:formate hydrogenlyase subunit 6/NADH:ubiquinone oxidoreductase subunit I|nr:4Fe-4S binding protein [Synergistales bacterium]MBP8996578.1 4Fe-4S binding protein [Synergistales bacterium]NMD17676.1 4Fe-4S binding protein [Synergistaceae bacterium]OQB47249.1 MAG: NAD(P)H-quinone oxidoreductase subunit I [Synergistetes bacterium ADurb.Bin155]HQL02883.1 4Fe-4S binding protein [Synergistales bacterium]